MRLPDRLGGPLLAAVLLLTPLPAGERVLVGQEASVTRQLQGEVRLVLKRFHGTLSLRGGKPGVLRYEARSQDRQKERPVHLWRDGDTLQLEAPPRAGAGEAQEPPWYLELAVPPELAVSLQVSDSRVTADGLRGGLELIGKRVDLDSHGLQNYARIELTGGSVSINGAERGLSIEGADLDVDITHAGTTFLKLARSKVRVGQLTAGLDADLDETTLNVHAVASKVGVKAHRGTVELVLLAAGADLRLDETPLALRETQGAVDVQTDSRVVFHTHRGALRIAGYEAGVRGAVCDGSLDLQIERAEVSLEDLDCPATVRGGDLVVKIDGTKKPLTIQTTSSSITVSRAEAQLTITNDYGEVEVIQASRQVQVTNRNGAVRVSELTGSLQLRASAPEVEVSWSALPGDQDSLVENEDGDVRVNLPRNASCRLEGEALRGRIESELAEVRVSDDGIRASGMLNRASRPMVQIRSGGNLYLGMVELPR